MQVGAVCNVCMPTPLKRGFSFLVYNRTNFPTQAVKYRKSKYYKYKTKKLSEKMKEKIRVIL